MFFSIPSLLDCHSYAVSRWKPALVPQWVFVEPDHWPCYKVRAAKDQNSSGLSPGSYVHKSALWGRTVVMTANLIIPPVRILLHTWPFSSSTDSADRACFTHNVLFVERIQLLGLLLVGSHKNTITPSARVSFSAWLQDESKICSAKHSCPNNLWSVVLGCVQRLVWLLTLLNYNSQTPC